MEKAIEVLEGAFRELAKKTVDMPLRSFVRSKNPTGVLVSMPSSLPDALGMKVVTVFPDNPKNHNGLRASQSTIFLNDKGTGRLAAILEADYITILRTGAVGGVATKYLSRKDSSIAGILGSGPQAESQLEAILVARPGVKKAKVYSRDPAHRNSYAKKMSEKLGIKVVALDSAREAVANSDIVSTATSSTKPVFFGEWLEPGMHVNAIGSGLPERREIDEESLLKPDKVIAEYAPPTLVESGDLIVPLDKGVVKKESVFYADLGEIVLGTRPGRENENEITLFKSVGLAIEDVAIAKFVYDAAQARDLGQTITL